MTFFKAKIELQWLRLEAAAIAASCGWKVGAEVQSFSSSAVAAMAGAETY